MYHLYFFVLFCFFCITFKRSACCYILLKNQFTNKIISITYLNRTNNLYCHFHMYCLIYSCHWPCESNREGIISALQMWLLWLQRSSVTCPWSLRRWTQTVLLIFYSSPYLLAILVHEATWLFKLMTGSFSIFKTSWLQACVASPL